MRLNYLSALYALVFALCMSPGCSAEQVAGKRPEPVVKVVPHSSNVSDLKAIHVDVHAPPNTPFVDLCRAISRGVGVRVDVERALSDEKVLVVAFDVPVGTLLERIAKTLNATLTSSRAGNSVRYQITQTVAQRKAEQALAEKPLRDLMQALDQDLKAGPGPADGSLPANVVWMRKTYPGLAGLFRRIPQSQWERLAQGSRIEAPPGNLHPELEVSCRSSKASCDGGGMDVIR